MTSKETANEAVIPLATYRLQFHKGFTFADATAIVPYLGKLGVSHCYASPYFKARPGSTHGYDVIDHGMVNPEIGTSEDFDRFVRALETHGMGQILDIAPNHMGVMGSDNQWWLDVLENGPASQYASYFDIDWGAVAVAGHDKLLVPVLGEQYGQALERGSLELRFDRELGALSVWYYEHRFPLDPATYPIVLEMALSKLDAVADEHQSEALAFRSLITAFRNLPSRTESDPERLAERQRDEDLHRQRLAELCERAPELARFVEDNVATLNGRAGEPASFDALHALIGAQAWRLAFWRVASDEINYRRFFDISDLAAVRVENAEVFTATHAFVLSLLAAGKIDGLRIDHLDGLYDPYAYLCRLQHRRADVPQPPASVHRSTFVVVEKILGHDEALPGDWPVQGTTGYDFANLVNGVFVPRAAAARMERIYRRFVRGGEDFETLLYRSKRLIMRTALAGELGVLADALLRIAQADRRTCDYTLNTLRDALHEVVACFPVYRTYLRGDGVSSADTEHIQAAIDAAILRSTAADASVFEFVREVTLMRIGEGRSEDYRELVLRFVMKLQQYTAPVMAKGFEDTALYSYNRLVSLNDVGGDPRDFGVGIAEFHAANGARLRQWPHALLTTSTHDSKRSADVRARINVLAELPKEWSTQVRRWALLNRKLARRRTGRVSISRNDEYLLYQTLIGVWPLAEPDAASLAELRDRIQAYMLKAIREAKAYTSWVNRNVEYEDRVRAFVEAILTPSESNEFLRQFATFARRVAILGCYNSLSQTVLTLTCPGTPDFYQGAELWDLRLVDPDNRGPVDYAHRSRLLDGVIAAAGRDDCGTLVASWLDDIEDGRIKLYIVWRLLELRRQQRSLFLHGDYIPLPVTGEREHNVIGFARHHGEAALVVLAARFHAGLGAEHNRATGIEVWQDTRVQLPVAGRWRDVLTGTELSAGDEAAREASLLVDTVFAHAPCAVLLRQ